MTAPKASNLTAERLRQFVHYDPLTGVFTRLRAHCGKPAGSRINDIGNHGYLRFFIDGRRYLLHRLAWLYITGQWPAHQIDHKDRNRSNNIFENLREATDALNAENHSLHANNTSGFRGVYWSADCRKWGAFISHNHKRIHLSVHSTKQEAIAARIKAEKQLFTFRPQDSEAKSDKSALPHEAVAPIIR